VKDAGTISRRQFVRMLNEALPLALVSPVKFLPLLRS
jgi:hypothetical protein